MIADIKINTPSVIVARAVKLTSDNVTGIAIIIEERVTTIFPVIQV